MECQGRLRLLLAARTELESFDGGIDAFDSWLTGAESQLRIMQRSVGDLSKFRQQTTDLQVMHFYELYFPVKRKVSIVHMDAHLALINPSTFH